MRITAVRVTPISIPRIDRLTTSYGSLDAARTVLVELETDTGLSGIGQTVSEAPFYGETIEGMLANIRAHLAPVVIGESPQDLRRLQSRLLAALPDHPSSVAGVELALWDLKAKLLDIPAYELFGGKTQNGITLMGSIPRTDAATMASAIDELLTAVPYPVVKIKIGVDPVTDIEIYRAVADSIAGRALIQVDGNAGYSLSDALFALPGMNDYHPIAAIEQPVASLADFTRLAQQIPAPFMVDELISSPTDAIQIVKSESASLAFIKPAKCGGILQTLDIAAILAAANIPMSIGIYYDILAAAVAHLSAALPIIGWPSPFTELTGSILTNPVQPQGLTIPVPDGVGWGVDLDRDNVERYRLDR